MEISELLKSSVVTSIELHGFLLILIGFLYANMHKSYIRTSKIKEKALTFVYIGTAIMVVSDSIWTTVSSLSTPGNILAYAINLIYFFGSVTAAYAWLTFCTKHLDSVFKEKKYLRIILRIVYIISLLIYFLSPWFGFIFTIENGEYIRGSLFFLDPLFKMGFIGIASIIAVVSGRKKDVKYLRRRDYNMAIFGLPVLIFGILQILTGVDFNCLGVTFALIAIYILGITNMDSENTDAIYSLANSFEAAYIVNMDTGLIRPLKQDIMHEGDIPGMESMNYMYHFGTVLSNIVLPEDKTRTLETFDIRKVEERLKLDSAFSIRYRVREKSGETSLHTAAFIRAMGNEGKKEFLLGITTLHKDSLIYERNETLKNENVKLEKINTSIIESVAKMVEARDGESGEHIVRVKRLTEVLAREIMEDYPEYELDDEMVKLISQASVLHDVGKIVIPDAILLKPGRLTDEEFEIMKTHSEKGCDILNLFPLGLDDAFLECALSICRWHHEKYDGKGYPDHLKGEDIPIAAQIVSAADCFDALLSKRPYKEGYPPEKAFNMVVNGDCGEFSPKIVHVMNKQKSKLMEMARLYNR